MYVSKTNVRALAKLFDQAAKRATQADVDLTAYQGRIPDFANEVLGVSLWSRQVDLLNAVLEHDQVVCAAANSVGKSFGVGVLLLYWTFCERAPSFVAGPTATSLQNIIFGGPMAALFHRANLPGELFTMVLKSDDNVKIQGVSSKNVHAAQGRHHPRLLCVIDEAQDPELDEVWQAFQANSTGDDNRQLAVGNALVLGGPFQQAFDDPDWFAIRIAATEHPNIVENDPTLIPGAITPKKLAQWKRSMPAELFASRAEALFPDAGDVTRVLYREDLEQSAKLHAQRARPSRGYWCFGLDVGRGGDHSVLTALCDGYLIAQHRLPRHRDLMATTGDVIRMLRDTYRRASPVTAQGYAPGEFQTESWRITVDSMGVGAGISDRLREQKYPVVEFNGSDRPVLRTTQDDATRFANRRAEAYWVLADRIKRGEVQIPHDEELWEELLILTWLPTSDGKFKLLQKEVLKRKLGRSPDKADSLAMGIDPASSRVTGLMSGGPGDLAGDVF